MKVVILAGGYGTRLSEETQLKPKPMVEIGGRPIIWHIMKHFSIYGFNDFIICCGYKGMMIKEYFYNYYVRHSDVTIDLGRNTTEIHNNNAEPWTVTLVDTGLDTMTGGRLRRIKNYLKDDTFFFTYGDGVSNVDLHALKSFHFESGAAATMTAVRPPGRFGSIMTNGDHIVEFFEKPPGDGAWVNGGFFVLNKTVIDLIDSDLSVWEQYPLSTLAKTRQLVCYKHDGFWQSMDTLRDKKLLDSMCSEGQTPWLNK